jgi:parallel beta-helix repeat protein
VNGTVSMVFFDQNISVTGCTFTKCDPGIYLSESSEALIKNNKFSYCQTGVVFGENGEGTAAYNTFGNCKTGIFVYKGSASITNNVFTKNGCGISISQEDRIYMNHNKYSENKKNILREPPY